MTIKANGESVDMLSRIKKLVELVREGDFPSKRDLAQSLCISESTVGRDIELFNDISTRYEIVFDSSHNGYGLKELIYR